MSELAAMVPVKVYKYCGVKNCEVEHGFNVSGRNAKGNSGEWQYCEISRQ